MADEMRFELRIDDDVYPVDGNVTVGRHLDNDVIVAGEDVLDYHLRLEAGERGVSVVPLASATYSLNGRETDARAGLLPGDRLGVGGTQLQLVLHRSPRRTADWSVRADRDGTRTSIGSGLVVGRQSDAGLRISSEHISRRHAEFVPIDGDLWLRDFDSANGTRVNGVPLQGGCCLFNGDEVAFDEFGYRVMAQGTDITAVRDFLPADLRPMVDTQDAESLPAISEPNREPSITRSQFVRPLPGPGEPHLVGLSGPVAGLRYPVRLGANRIGRHPDCEIRVDLPDLADVEAVLQVLADRISLTALSGVSTPSHNGVPTRLAMLHDGDSFALGEASFGYRAGQGAARSAARPRPLIIAALLGALLTAGVLAWFSFH